LLKRLRHYLTKKNSHLVKGKAHYAAIQLFLFFYSFFIFYSTRKSWIAPLTRCFFVSQDQPHFNKTKRVLCDSTSGETNPDGRFLSAFLARGASSSGAWTYSVCGVSAGGL
jgi:hypothetical protein